MKRSPSQLCSLLLAAAIFTATPAATADLIEPDPRAAALLDDTQADIPVFGTPGILAVWGSKAQVVLAGGKEKGILAPVAARGTLGTGRVVCFAHTGYVGKLDAGSARTLLTRSVQWARRPGQKLRVGTIHTDAAASLVEELGPDATVTRIDKDWTKALGGYDCLVVSGWDFNDAQVQALTDFARNGGGLVAGQTAWAWNAPDGATLCDNPLNRVMAGAGIAWTDEYAGKTGKEGFAPRPGPAVLHARDALKALSTPDGGKGKDDPRQAAACLVSAARVLGPKDLELRPQLLRQLRERGKDLLPSEQHPLKANDALGRALVAFSVSELGREQSPKAHAAAVDFPGQPAPGSSPANISIKVDRSRLGWHSTGVYAVAGEPVTITLSDAAQAKGLRVRIGCHQDELWHLGDWKRIPQITLERPMSGASMRLTSAFGGPVYVVVNDPKATGTFDVKIEGGCAAPLYVLGETTDEQWKQLRGNPGPWAELVTSKVCLSVPSEHVRTLENPRQLMEFWDKVLDAQADLATIPRERAKPQRYVADRQISAGYMHSGYPIMTHLDAAADMADLTRMQQGPWGLFHELGHNHQVDLWTFEGTGEVTCNLFAMYTIETVCEKPWIKGHDGLSNRGRQIAKYVGGGRKFETWKSDPFLALQMYAQLVEGFGWETFKKVFAEYRDLAKGEWPGSQEERRDAWMVRFSRACGKNLGPFFEAWGVPVSAQAKSQVASLPAWMPKDMPAAGK
ncbi:MAG: M60 family metallopeptidase [Planctomycetota bacterium]|nr:M60 family metallopeptidase [Planctomycetota bacterium]